MRLQSRHEGFLTATNSAARRNETEFAGQEEVAEFTVEPARGTPKKPHFVSASTSRLPPPSAAGPKRVRDEDEQSQSAQSESDTVGISPRSLQYIEGKRFFKLARERLTFEEFNKFIAQIQNLNRGKQTKEATVAAVETIFGKGNDDLLTKLKELLLRKRL